MSEIEQASEDAPSRVNTDYKRLCAGVIFTAIGIVMLFLSTRLRLGTLTSLGPGGFPAILAALLTIFGVAHIVSACAGGFPRSSIGGWTKHAVYLIPLSVVAFGVLLDRLGLIPAAVVSTFIGSLANQRIRLLEAILISIFLAVFAALLFVKTLGLPLDLFKLH